MCDEHTLQKEVESRRQLGWSRRDFNLLALSAAAIAMLPGTAVAADIEESMVDIRTSDGVADCYFAHPTKGKYPGVLLWPDYFSLRPAYKQLAKKLAQSGYSVLVINQYYRSEKSPVVEKVDFDDKSTMALMSKLSGALSATTLVVDSKAVVAFLDRQPSVDTGRKIGAMGYCMGGGFTFHTAAAVPDRIGAIASFHGGGLVSKESDSTHLLIPKFKAHALIAIAEGDDKRDPETKTILRTAFAAAKLPAEIEVYVGAKHGWCTPDMTELYSEAHAQRAWGRLLALFARALA